jgi:hypothetical protein
VRCVWVLLLFVWSYRLSFVVLDSLSIRLIWMCLDGLDRWVRRRGQIGARAGRESGSGLVSLGIFILQSG